ncbi:MAG: hypothetical protein U5R30_04390 [Deltaproteobacteria bacterium]|nr:hypothetical protein [Deltaproteobacteria bacterium]
MPDLTVDDLDLAALKTLFRGTTELDQKELLTLRLLKTRARQTKGAVLICRKRALHFPDAGSSAAALSVGTRPGSSTTLNFTITCPRRWTAFAVRKARHAAYAAFLRGPGARTCGVSLGDFARGGDHALVHADYAQAGAPIRVAFFDDRIRVENGISPWWG